MLAVSLAGCSSPAATPAATPTALATPPSTTPAPALASVQIKDFAFSPLDARVAKGGTVTWTNLESDPHTVRFADAESGVLGNGGTYSRTFDETGTFDYTCGIHPSMRGRVVVV